MTKAGTVPSRGDLSRRSRCVGIGRGEQDVFEVQPYRDESLPVWTTKNGGGREEAAEAIHDRYEEYREAGDFPEIGYTRAMRYAKYPAEGSTSTERTASPRSRRIPRNGRSRCVSRNASSRFGGYREAKENNRECER